MTIGVVTDSLNPVAELYFQEMQAADANYGDDLDYIAVPPQGLPLYNSNGFVRGLVGVTGGQPSPDISNFPGAWNVVPSSEFQ